LRFTSAVAGANTAYNSAYATATTFQATTNLVSASSPAISYCWHSVEGFSKFGSYTANGTTDNAFVYCGFRPAFLLVKSTDIAVTSWNLVDNKRDIANVMSERQQPNNAAIDNSATVLDFTANGFKIRAAGADMGNTGTYIYAAFAEQPFKYSNGR